MLGQGCITLGSTCWVYFDFVDIFTYNNTMLVEVFSQMVSLARGWYYFNKLIVLKSFNWLKCLSCPGIEVNGGRITYVSVFHLTLDSGAMQQQEQCVKRNQLKMVWLTILTPITNIADMKNHKILIYAYPQLMKANTKPITRNK